MDYRKFLGRKEEHVLPYLGGASVTAAGRALRVAQQVAPGWWRFSVQGRVAVPEAPVATPDLDGLPAVRGHLLGGRLVRDGAVAEVLHLLPEEEPPPLAPCVGRRWHDGTLLFAGLEFEGGAEELARAALDEGGTLTGARGVPATLRAAFGYAVAEATAARLQIPVSPLELRAHVHEFADGGRPAAEAALRSLQAEREAAALLVRARREALLQQARQAEAAAARAEAARLREAAAPRPAAPLPPAQRQWPPEPRPGGPQQQPVAAPWEEAQRPARPRRSAGAAADPWETRAEAALLAAGAEFVRGRRLEQGLVEVAYRFLGERFLSVVHAATLQVVDAGVCLAGADQLVTLESLPSVIREAIDTGRLVITRRER